MKTKKRDARKAPEEAPEARSKFWIYCLGIAAGLFAAFQAYAPALNGPFLFDDLFLPMSAPDAARLPLWGWVYGVRPLLMLTYWANYQLSGLDTASYHAWNVIFHFGNALLVYFIVRKLLQLSGGPQKLALFAGGLFLLHPAQTESVAYIAGRSDCLSSLFALAAFALFLYRRSPAATWPVALGVMALFAAAVATKENTVVLPAVFLLTDYFWNPGYTFEGIRRNWRLYVPIAGVGAIGIVRVIGVLGRSYSAGFGMKDLPWYAYLFTQFRVFFDYLRLFVFPSGQTVDYDYPISHSILDHESILALIGILALAGAAVYYRKRYPLACFGFFAFAILLAPTSSVVPIQDPISERRLYLPMLGLLLVLMDAIMELLHRVKIGQTALAAGLSAVLVISAGLTYRRNLVWSGAIPLWENAVKESPAKWRTHFQLGHAYFSANLCEQAGDQYRLASKLDKPDFRLLVDWALADNCLGKSDDAIAKLKQAAGLERSAHVYSQPGMMYAKTGRTQEALQALDTAQSIDPRFETTYIYRGQIYMGANDLKMAAEQFRLALGINPGNTQALEFLEQIRQRSRTPR